MAHKGRALILITGEDKPGVSKALFSALSEFSIIVEDIEQVVIRGRLILTLLIQLDPHHISMVEEDLIAALTPLEMDIAIDLHENIEKFNVKDLKQSYFLTIVSEAITPRDINIFASLIASYFGNIDAIRRTSEKPVIAIEFSFTLPEEANIEEFRRELRSQGKGVNVDVALENAGLGRKAKRIVFLDMDSTFIQQEVIDLLAAKAGVGDQVAAITEAAMRGELDFKQSLTHRVSLLEGMDQVAISEVAAEIQLTPGAKNLVTTLHRLGHKVGIVSGGFLNVIEPLLKEMEIDYYNANTLEVKEGKLTGKVIGEIVDARTKANALTAFAQSENVPLSQTIAIGDGANDLEMINIAGLGIAFNAKPKVQDLAGSTINNPYLDSVLYFMGITQEEIAF